MGKKYEERVRFVGDFDPQDILKGIRQIQNQLNKTLKQFEDLNKKESRDIEKEKALQHRPEFISGRNSVRTTQETPDCITKQFKKLSAQERKDIYNYIKNNLFLQKLEIKK